MCNNSTFECSYIRELRFRNLVIIIWYKMKYAKSTEDNAVSALSYIYILYKTCAGARHFLAPLEQSYPNDSVEPYYVL